MLHSMKGFELEEIKIGAKLTDVYLRNFLICKFSFYGNFLRPLRFCLSPHTEAFIIDSYTNYTTSATVRYVNLRRGKSVRVGALIYGRPVAVHNINKVT